MMDFGQGPPLIETCLCCATTPSGSNGSWTWLRRNSVIEGLPPFGKEERRRLREVLHATSAELAPSRAE